MIGATLVLAGGLFASPASAELVSERSEFEASIRFVQSDMPVIPPPGQRAQPLQGQALRTISIDDLARMGYDVKAIDRAGQAEGRYVVMMQRAGDVKTCLMRIEAQRGQPPQRQSACF